MVLRLQQVRPRIILGLTYCMRFLGISHEKKKKKEEDKTKQNKKTKIRRLLSSDKHCLILYHVMHFI